MKNWQSRISGKVWAYLALAIWGFLSFILLNKTPYGVDEGAARALLLVWTVTEDLVSPIVTLGMPDFRALFMAPVGFLWPGNLLAAKIFTMLVMAVAAWSMHRWNQRNGDTESPLLATGLLLISPLLIDQIDTISLAPYLLLVFVLGAWTDQRYRESLQAFGGMYFSQLILCLVSVTLHPIGLAYPLSLLWSWYRNPTEGKHRSYIFGGVLFVVFLALLLTMGWHNVDWLSNPARSLSGVFRGTPGKGDVGILGWMIGVAMLVIAIAVIWKQARSIWSDTFGRTLLVAFIMGLAASDATWSIVVLTICLYWGFPLLLKASAASPSGFWSQRGIALTLLFVISTAFMLADKMHYQLVMSGVLSPRDKLIKTLVEDAGIFSNEETDRKSISKKPIHVASQWPGITMLACRCDALPLPPPAKNSDALLALLKGVDYLIFDPHDPVNKPLSQNLATMDAGRVETIALQSGGVIIEIKNRSPSNKQ